MTCSGWGAWAWHNLRRGKQGALVGMRLMLAVMSGAWSAGRRQEALRSKQLRNAGYPRLPWRRAALVCVTQAAGHGKRREYYIGLRKHVPHVPTTVLSGWQVNLTQPRCEAGGCQKIAYYGYPGGTAVFCRAHRLEDMVSRDPPMQCTQSRTVEMCNALLMFMCTQSLREGMAHVTTSYLRRRMFEIQYVGKMVVKSKQASGTWAAAECDAPRTGSTTWWGHSCFWTV